MTAYTFMICKFLSAYFILLRPMMLRMGDERFALPFYMPVEGKCINDIY